MCTVKSSLRENDLTVLSIFVNPAQFAPHEDLATYPRTLPRDLELLATQTEAISALPPSHHTNLNSDPASPSAGPQIHTRTPSAVFLPSVQEMYPSGISQDRSVQRGTFVEVKGYGDEMEGKSRPGFFRGVATVVTKLFNVVQVCSANSLTPGMTLIITIIPARVSRHTRTLAKKTSSKRCCCADSAATSFSPTLHLSIST